jgi:ribosomal protein L22
MSGIVNDYERLLDYTKKHQKAVSEILPVLNGMSTRDAKDVLKSVEQRLDEFPLSISV